MGKVIISLSSTGRENYNEAQLGHEIVDYLAQGLLSDLNLFDAVEHIKLQLADEFSRVFDLGVV